MVESGPEGTAPAEDAFVPHLSGYVAGDRHLLPIRVYYEDTDFSGIVYHANYLRFLERGRTESLRLLGANQSDLHAGDGLFFAVSKMIIDWKSPARMDDVLLIESRTREVRGASLIIDQRILRGAQVLLTAEVRVAAIAGGKPARIPDAMRELLTSRGS